MAGEKRYAVTVGVCILPADVKSVTDVGLRYGKLRYEDMVAVEGVLAKHKASLDAALEPIIKDMIAMGVEQSEKNSR